MNAISSTSDLKSIIRGMLIDGPAYGSVGIEVVYHGGKVVRLEKKESIVLNPGIDVRKDKEEWL